MTPSVIEAVRLAQEQSLTSKSGHRHHCLDLALDELLRHPHADGDPRTLLARALAHARTHIRRRNAAFPCTTSSPAVEGTGDLSDRASDDTDVMLEVDWIRRAPLSDAERGLLLCAVADTDPKVLSEALNLPLRRVRERMSRARSHARAARERAEAAA